MVMLGTHSEACVARQSGITQVLARAARLMGVFFTKSGKPGAGTGFGTRQEGGGVRWMHLCLRYHLDSPEETVHLKARLKNE